MRTLPVNETFFLSYIAFVKEFFQSAILVLVLTDVLAIVCSLFALVISDWFIGVFMVITVTFQLFVLCMFGTAVVIKVMNLLLRKKILLLNYFSERRIPKENL